MAGNVPCRVLLADGQKCGSQTAIITLYAERGIVAVYKDHQRALKQGPLMTTKGPLVRKNWR